jgi:hypothetical protein
MTCWETGFAGFTGWPQAVDHPVHPVILSSGWASRAVAAHVVLSEPERCERMSPSMPNQTLEPNRRPAPPLDAGRKCARAIHDPPCASGGGRSVLALGMQMI